MREIKEFGKNIIKNPKDYTKKERAMFDKDAEPIESSATNPNFGKKEQPQSKTNWEINYVAVFVEKLRELGIDPKNQARIGVLFNNLLSQELTKEREKWETILGENYQIGFRDGVKYAEDNEGQLKKR